MNIGLIMSGNYVGPNLRNEFGRIPPAFLPVSSSRLFMKQISYLLKLGIGWIYISVPEDYVINEYDKQILTDLPVSLIPIDPKMGSGESFRNSIASILSTRGNVELTVLFGDTLFPVSSIPGRNTISVSIATSDLEWGVPKSCANNDLVYTGLMRLDLNENIIRNVEKNYKSNFPGLFDSLVKCADLSLEQHDDWYDFGHLATFYQSSAKHLNSRVFNELTFTDTVATKKSADADKIKSEILWYEHLPTDLKTFTPQLVSSKKNIEQPEYSIELLYQPTLAALAVYGSLTKSRWEIIFRSCFKFLKASHSDGYSADFYNNLFSKTDKRMAETDLNLFNAFNGKDAHLKLISRLNKKYSEWSVTKNSYAHGDFCFSNILFDTRSERIKVIDPRGKTSFGPGEFDCVLYDIAKLAHSVIGGYDLIIQKRYNVITENEINKIIFPDLQTKAWKDMEEAFFSQLQVSYPNVTIDLLKFLCGHLFTSMLPLHSDDRERQFAILLNAQRLFLEAS